MQVSSSHHSSAELLDSDGPLDTLDEHGFYILHHYIFTSSSSHLGVSSHLLILYLGDLTFLIFIFESPS